MLTIQSDIETALFTRVAALVLSPALPVAWPVSPSPSRSVATCYLRVTHVPNIARRLFLGSSDPHQRLGLLQVDVFQPLNKGATEIAGKVAEHFACGTEMWSGGLRVSVTKAPDVAQAMADDTQWVVPVMVRYEIFA